MTERNQMAKGSFSQRGQKALFEEVGSEVRWDWWDEMINELCLGTASQTEVKSKRECSLSKLGENKRGPAWPENWNKGSVVWYRGGRVKARSCKDLIQILDRLSLQWKSTQGIEADGRHELATLAFVEAWIKGRTWEQVDQWEEWAL